MNRSLCTFSGNSRGEEFTGTPLSFQASFKGKNCDSYMQFEDYQKLTKLRVVVSDEISSILKEYHLVADEKSWNKSRYRLGRRALPIRLLLKSPEATMKVMESKPLFLTHGGVQVRLPTEIDEGLSYLCGLICGDGNLHISKKRDYLVSVHNIEKALLEETVRLLEENFNYSAKIEKGHYCLKVLVQSEVIHSFLNKILEIENGRKENIRIPSKIKKSRNLVRAFIAGFFDAEGNVALQKNKMTCQISLAQKQKGILEEIRIELRKDGIPTKFIKSNGCCWQLYGNKASLAPFLEKIPFIHPEKREKLETALRNQTIWQNQKVSSDAAKSPTTCFPFCS